MCVSYFQHTVSLLRGTQGKKGSCLDLFKKKINPGSFHCLRPWGGPVHPPDVKWHFGLSWFFWLWEGRYKTGEKWAVWAWSQKHAVGLLKYKGCGCSWGLPPLLSLFLVGWVCASQCKLANFLLWSSTCTLIWGLSTHFNRSGAQLVCWDCSGKVFLLYIPDGLVRDALLEKSSLMCPNFLPVIFCWWWLLDVWNRSLRLIQTELC